MLSSFIIEGIAIFMFHVVGVCICSSCGKLCLALSEISEQNRLMQLNVSENTCDMVCWQNILLN